MDNIIQMKDKLKASIASGAYVQEGESEEDLNQNDKYETTGESEFSREASHPIDEVLSERHYLLSGVQSFFRERFRQEKNDYSGIAPKGYSRPDDSILEEVNETLMRSRRVNPSDLTVEVKEGIVTLEGVVPTRAMKKSAESLVEKVAGVKDVINKVSIGPFGKPLVDNRTGLN